MSTILKIAKNLINIGNTHTFTLLGCCWSNKGSFHPLAPPPQLYQLTSPGTQKIESRRLATNPCSIFPSYITRLLPEWLPLPFLSRMCVIPPKIESYRGLHNPCFPPSLPFSIKPIIYLEKEGKERCFLSTNSIFCAAFYSPCLASKKSLVWENILNLKSLQAKKICSRVTLPPPPDIFLHILTFSFGGKAGVDVPKDKSFPALLLPPSLKSRKRRRKERESGVSPLPPPPPPSPGQMGGKDAKTKKRRRRERFISQGRNDSWKQSSSPLLSPSSSSLLGGESRFTTSRVKFTKVSKHLWTKA